MASISITAQGSTSFRLRRALRDSLLILQTNVRHFLAQPGEIVGVILMPIIFTVLFGYVFGSAIQIPGVENYRDYLMPGIIAMSATFTMVAAAVSMAELKEKGQMDRFRSLPMARSAVLVGQTLYQVGMALVGMAVMVICAVATGWRIHTDVSHAIAGFGLLILFTLAMNFLGTCIGLVVPTAQTADQVMMSVTMPLTFLANTFIAVEGLPGWLKWFADWNPLSATVAAVRDLFGNAPTIAQANQPWSLEHPVITMVAWSILLIAIALPLSVRLYHQQD